MTAVPETSSSFVDLTPFVPRVVVDWLRVDPEARHRRLEGTLAFVDISGFTALNERLAQKGKLGAEEVTAVMNRTFERLLDVAYAFGGGLLKFGGDALLLFFTGEDHAPRACDAAYGMRTALRELGQPQTSVGTVELKAHRSPGAVASWGGIATGSISGGPRSSSSSRARVSSVRG